MDESTLVIIYGLVCFAAGMLAAFVGQYAWAVFVG